MKCHGRHNAAILELAKPIGNMPHAISLPQIPLVPQVRDDDEFWNAVRKTKGSASNMAVPRVELDEEVVDLINAVPLSNNDACWAPFNDGSPSVQEVPDGLLDMIYSIAKVPYNLNVKYTPCSFEESMFDDVIALETEQKIEALDYKMSREIDKYDAVVATSVYSIATAFAANVPLDCIPDFDHAKEKALFKVDTLLC